MLLVALSDAIHESVRRSQQQHSRGVCRERCNTDIFKTGRTQVGRDLLLQPISARNMRASIGDTWRARRLVLRSIDRKSKSGSLAPACFPAAGRALTQHQFIVKLHFKVVTMKSLLQTDRMLFLPHKCCLNVQHAMSGPYATELPPAQYHDWARACFPLLPSQIVWFANKGCKAPNTEHQLRSKVWTINDYSLAVFKTGSA